MRYSRLRCVRLVPWVFVASVLGFAASATAANPASLSQPDSNASVNATPNGVFSSPSASRGVTVTATSKLAITSTGIQPQAITTNPHGCPSTYACGWVNLNFGTPMGRWAGTNSDFRAFFQPACALGNWSDCISSMFNNGTSCTVHWWANIGFGGGEYSIARGFGDSDLRTSGWNDRISSNSWC